MGKANPKYSDAFIITALKQLEDGKTVQEVAKAFKTNTTTIYRWIQQAEKGKISGFTLSGDFKLRVLQKYDDDFRIAAVRRIEAGESRAQVARDLQVSKRSLDEWCMKFRDPNFEKVRGEEEAQRIVQTVRATDALKEKLEADTERRLQQAIHQTADRVQRMTTDPLIWMQRYTQTRDSHWREHGSQSPYRPFPEKSYLRAMMDGLKKDPIVFIEKSRNMLLSWLCVGYFTHAAMTTPEIEVRFQSQKEDKAFELVEYAKVLYERQDPELQEAFPLVKKLRDMADGELLFANGSRIVGIPAGADQIRSYHPWGLLMDEAAFMPDGLDSYNNAPSVCKKIIVLSSAAPGWFADISASAV